MVELRSTARIYIAALALLALGMTTSILLDAVQPTMDEIVLALAFVGLTTLASCFPLHFAHKTKLTLDTSLLIAVVLLFTPDLAILIAGVSAGLAHAVRREPGIQAVFNVSQTTLQAGAAGLLLAAAGWHDDALRFTQPDQLLLVAIAVTAMYLINSGSVAVIVSLQSGLSPKLVWRDMISFGAVEHVAQLGLGLLVAAVTDSHALALPIFLLPVGAVYLSIERQIRLRRQTLDAVESLADLVDLRDPYTANHSRRVAAYARELATALDLSPGEVDLIERAARVHDIGKIVIDQVVLGKEGKLDAHEWEQLKRHPVSGVEVLSRFPLFTPAICYVRHHHERIDGRGYPDGLTGDQIPLGARIIAVADSFDAMSSARPYRAALSTDVVLAELTRQRGQQWDEQVVDTLLALVAQGEIRLPADKLLAPECRHESVLLPAPA